MKKKANEMYMRFQTRSDAPSEKDPYTYNVPFFSADGGHKLVLTV